MSFEFFAGCDGTVKGPQRARRRHKGHEEKSPKLINEKPPMYNIVCMKISSF